MSTVKTGSRPMNYQEYVTCAFCQGHGTDPFSVMSSLSVCGACQGAGHVLVTALMFPARIVKAAGVTRLTAVWSAAGRELYPSSKARPLSVQSAKAERPMDPAGLSVFIVEAGRSPRQKGINLMTNSIKNVQGHCDLSERLGFPPRMCRRPHPITSSDTHMGLPRSD